MNEQRSFHGEEGDKVKKVSYHDSFTAEHELLPRIWRTRHKQSCLENKLFCYHMRTAKMKEKLDRQRKLYKENTWSIGGANVLDQLLRDCELCKSRFSGFFFCNFFNCNFTARTISLLYFKSVLWTLGKYGAVIRPVCWTSVWKPTMD